MMGAWIGTSKITGRISIRPSPTSLRGRAQKKHRNQDDTFSFLLLEERKVLFISSVLVALPLLSPVPQEPIVQLLLLAHSLLIHPIAVLVLLAQDLRKQALLSQHLLLFKASLLRAEDVIDLFGPALGPFCVVE